jgi:hypothetical protein
VTIFAIIKDSIGVLGAFWISIDANNEKDIEFEQGQSMADHINIINLQFWVSQNAFQNNRVYSLCKI